MSSFGLRTTSDTEVVVYSRSPSAVPGQRGPTLRLRVACCLVDRLACRVSDQAKEVGKTKEVDRFHGQENYTETVTERLLQLTMYLHLLI